MKKIIKKLITWALYSNDDQCEPETKKMAVAGYGSGVASESPMTFTVMNANGGKIIQFIAYNKASRTDETRLYIITDMEKFGEELSQIILTESLSR